MLFGVEKSKAAEAGAGSVNVVKVVVSVRSIFPPFNLLSAHDVFTFSSMICEERSCIETLINSSQERHGDCLLVFICSEG